MMFITKLRFLLPLLCTILIANLSGQYHPTFADDKLPFQDSSKDSSQYSSQGLGGAASSMANTVGDSDEMIVDLGGVDTAKSKTWSFLQYVIAMIFGFAVIVVVFAGFKITMSEGDPRQLRTAKMQIIYAGIGIGIAVLAEVILQFFQDVLS